MSGKGLHIVKIGTNVISDATGRLDGAVLDDIARQIAALVAEKTRVVLVSSGAIGAGIGELDLKKRPRDIVMRQVCAAVGQGVLMGRFHDSFARFGVRVAQVLLTPETFRRQKARVNLHNSVRQLLKLGIVPIVNENDAIAIDEIGENFGDNDRLSALLAVFLQAKRLVMLTDVDGVYGPGRVLLDVLLKKSQVDFSPGRESRLGRGGMQSKVQAAFQCARSGIPVVIANGRKGDTLERVFGHLPVGTLIPPVV